MIFGTQLCKWIGLLIILVNLLRCATCISLTWWRNVDVTEIMPFTVHVTLSPCCRERRQILSLHFIGHPIRQIWIRWTTTSIWGIVQERAVYRSRIHDVNELKEHLLSEYGGCWTTPRQRLRNGVVVWMHVYCVRVNGGHFEHKFWASHFLLCFTCFVDTGFRKRDRYKHAHCFYVFSMYFIGVSGLRVLPLLINGWMCKVLILCEMCYFCVWDFHTVW